MALPSTCIVFVGRTFRGHNHDDTTLQPAFPPERDGLHDLQIRVDWGSQGLQSDDHLDQLDMPSKKPRQSQKNPQAAFSAAPKAVHKAVSHLRLFVEQAIGGRKRDTILVHSFRNRTEHFEDDAIGVCAGLWNLVLSY